MANIEKKTVTEVKKTEAVKPAETKAAAEVKAEEVKAAAPVAEKKPAEKKPVEKKTAEKKPAAKKPAAKKTAAAKTENKSAAKTAAKAPKAAKTAKAPKVSPYEAVVAKSQKKFATIKTAKVKYPIAVNIELSGSAEGIFYVYISEAGKPAVEPYKWNDYDVYVRADADAYNKILDGKLSVYDALADGDLHVEGTVKKALMFFLSAF